MRRLCWAAGFSVLAFGIIQLVTSVIWIVTSFWAYREHEAFAEANVGKPVTPEMEAQLEAFSDWAPDEFDEPENFLNGDIILSLVFDGAVLALTLLIGMILIKLPKWIETGGAKL